MKHTKRRLISPMGAGGISHVLYQRVGLTGFRSVYRHHRNEDRRTTASGLLRARQHVRQQVAQWQEEVAADAVQAARIHAINSRTRHPAKQVIKKSNFTKK